MNAIAPWLVLALLAAMPIPLASVEPGWRATWTAAFAVLGIAVFIARWQLRRELVVPRSALAACALLAVAAVQLLPIEVANGEASGLLFDAPTRTALSVVPARTSARLGELIAMLALFCVTAIVLHDVRRRRHFALGLVAIATGFACHGLLVVAEWLPAPWPGQDRSVVASTFYNRNHFAGLLAIAILVGLGRLLASGRERRSSLPERLGLTAGLVVCTTALVGSGSRGGVAATACGALVLVLVGTPRARRLRWLALAIVVIGVVASLAPGAFVDRVNRIDEELASAGRRPDIWLGAWRAFLAFPWFGSGLGTFGDVSVAWQSPSVPGHVEHAHCDPLQLAVECGVLGFVAGTSLLVHWLRAALRGLEATPRGRRLPIAGAIAAVLAVALHSVVEFDLQIPADLAWVTVAAGLAVAGGPGIALRAPIVWSVVALLAWVAGDQTLRACAAFRAESAARSGPLETALLRWEDAHALHGGAGEAALAAGWRLAQERGDTIDWHQVERFAREAVARNPLAPSAHALLALALQAEGAAGALLHIERSLALVNAHERPRARLDRAVGACALGDTVTGAALLREVLRSAPKLRRVAIERVYAALPSVEAMRALVPGEDSSAWYELARLLLERGEFADRELALDVARPGRRGDALLTIDDGARLLSAEVSSNHAEGAHVVQVDARFGVARGVPPASIAYRIRGESAVLAKSFAPTEGSRRDRFVLDSTLPPGIYSVELVLGGTAVPYPLDVVRVAPRLLELAVGRTLAATELFWSTGDPGQRSRDGAAVPLRESDVLWSTIVVPSLGCEIAVVGSRVDALQPSIDGEPLALSGSSARLARFRVPGGASTRRLELRGAPGRMPSIESLFVSEWVRR